MDHPEAAGNPEVARVTADIAERAPASLSDPMAPIYHFRPETGWMNDVNGLLQHGGFTHAFYQLHPYSTGFGRMYWGHARSRDLVHWERLPVAIWPSLEKGEKGCWSGCAVRDERGDPMIFYTAVFNDREEGWKVPFQQWAAVPADEDLIVWKKHSRNPILDYASHAAPGFGTNWRDPFIFELDHKRYLTLCTGRDEHPLPLYEARNGELTQWKYLGTIHDRNAECPNFFRLGDRWVFLTSAYRNGTEYSTGAFDRDGLSFTPSVTGSLDLGSQSEGSKSLYGTNVLFDDRGRCLLFGRLNGFDAFSAANGWNGCMALPRALSLDRAGRLLQEPVAETEALRRRGTHRRIAPVSLDNGAREVAAGLPNALELSLRVAAGSARSCGVSLYCRADPREPLTIAYARGTLSVLGTDYKLRFPGDAGAIDLRVLLDRSLVEVFVDGGLETLSRVFTPGVECRSLELFARGGRADFGACELWEMEGIW